MGFDLSGLQDGWITILHTWAIVLVLKQQKCMLNVFVSVYNPASESTTVHVELFRAVSSGRQLSSADVEFASLLQQWQDYKIH